MLRGRSQDELAFLPPPYNLIFDAIGAIISFLFTPPVLWVTLSLIGLCILYALYLRYKEQIDPYIFMVLDFFYAIWLVFVWLFQAFKWCAQRTWYPIKEGFWGAYDAVDVKWNPHKKKVPYTHIPGFSY
mmetsp:Transcript_2234/g.3850  ORF Transcript_2234/g.3850 Transcript_2234/m.3850 type:complete len:129 (+) Transcript_2234:147-533(+)